MPRDYRLYLDDILEAVAKIERYVAGMDLDAFAGDERTADAVVRNLAVIGEAARALPAEAKAKTPEIEWEKIVGLRNILTHEYFAVSLAVVWDIVHGKLGQLREASQRLLDEAEA